MCIRDRYMVDKNLFDNPNIYHEYILLLRENFIILTQEKQQIIIDWIEKGPDLDEYKRRFEEWHGRSPNKEEFEHYRKNWQRDRLSWLEESLPKELAKYFEKLIEKLGKPDDPTIPSYAIATWEGPTSPKSIEELKRLSIEELVQFLKTWQPSKDFTAPSPEGLGPVSYTHLQCMVFSFLHSRLSFLEHFSIFSCKEITTSISYFIK